MSDEPTGVIRVYNVIEMGAKGDGTGDDAPIINQAFTDIYDTLLNNNWYGGGVVYFPPGIYRIESSLKVPPHTSVIGLGGNFTQQGAYGSEYYKHQPTLIKLGEEVGANIIEPYPAPNNCPFTTLEGVVIQNLQLQGNYIPEVTDPQNYHGIYFPDSTEGDKRSNLTLIDVMIFDINGSGFYGGSNQSEYSMRNVLTRKNREHGFVIQGQDNSFHKVASGENGLSGFHFFGGGGHRIIEMDAWGNKKGVVIENSLENVFVKLNTDLNVEEGVWIRNSGDLVFTDCTFKRNSKIYGGDYTRQYSNVKLEGNAAGHGPYAVRFIGCKFGESNLGGATLPNAKYGIEDVSEITKSNQLVSCTFKTKDFELGNVNDKILKSYIITNCLAWGDYGDERFWKNRFNEVGETTIQVDDHLLEIMPIVNPDDEEYVTPIFLPVLDSAMQIGKTFTIIRKNNLNKPNAKLKVVAPNGLINGSTDPFELHNEPPELVMFKLTFLGTDNTWRLLWQLS